MVSAATTPPTATGRFLTASTASSARSAPLFLASSHASLARFCGLKPLLQLAAPCRAARPGSARPRSAPRQPWAASLTSASPASCMASRPESRRRCRSVTSAAISPPASGPTSVASASASVMHRTTTPAIRNSSAAAPSSAGFLARLGLGFGASPWPARARPWHRPCPRRSAGRTARRSAFRRVVVAPVRHGSSSSSSRCRWSRPGLDQPDQREADDRRAGQRDARALADEFARVVDQLVGILGARCGWRHPRARRRPCGHIRHIPRRAAHRAGGGVADQLARHWRALRSTARAPGRPARAPCRRPGRTACRCRS